MSATGRFGLATGLLLLGVVGQYVLLWHLHGAQATFPPLRQPLDKLPRQVRTAFQDPKETHLWVGLDLPMPENFLQRKDLRIDDALYRKYDAPSAGLSADLYCGYSDIADDRKHHPIVCLNAVMGVPEDDSGRKLVFLDAEKKRPAQRFLFRTPTRPTTVYYWHYTWPSNAESKLGPLQEIHQKFSRPTPSMTVQIFTHAVGEGLDQMETYLLPKVDAILRSDFVPAGATVDCYWLNIGVVRN